VRLASGRTLEPDRPIVTFVNRRFEPMRGVHTFMRALPAFLARVPNAEVVLIGADDSGVYGQRPPDGMTWKSKMLAEVGDGLDLARLHFVGTVPHADMLALMSLSAAHVYLTYPFALSWSFLEAMALGCLVVGSRTAPVEEVIEHGRNGLLVDFFDPAALADTLAESCTRGRAASERMRQAARQTVLDRYDRRRVSEPAWLKLIDATLAGGPRT
jgi:glycosyltransferase involved in cell wall biosynthesis